MNPPASIPRIEREQCTGCGRCVAACAARLLTLDTAAYRKTATLTAPDRCTRCNRCSEECPFGAISPVFRLAEGKDREEDEPEECQSQAE